MRRDFLFFSKKRGRGILNGENFLFFVCWTIFFFFLSFQKGALINLDLPFSLSLSLFALNTMASYDELLKSPGDKLNVSVGGGTRTYSLKTLSFTFFRDVFPK